MNCFGICQWWLCHHYHHHHMLFHSLWSGSGSSSWSLSSSSSSSVEISCCFAVETFHKSVVQRWLRTTTLLQKGASHGLSLQQIGMSFLSFRAWISATVCLFLQVFAIQASWDPLRWVLVSRVWRSPLHKIDCSTWDSCDFNPVTNVIVDKVAFLIFFVVEVIDTSLNLEALSCTEKIGVAKMKLQSSPVSW